MARNNKGSAVADVVIAACILVFVLLPVFSLVAEKYILSVKINMIRDAVDMTNISAYNALMTGSLGKVQVDFSRDEAGEIFKRLLCVNLGLDEGLMPGTDSIAEGPVEIRSIEMYTEGFPTECPEGVIITRPSFHSCISVPIKPTLYRRIVLGMLDRQFIEMVIHMDSEIPLNN